MLQHAEHVEALRALLARGEPAWITSDGRSMEPTLMRGDRVCVRAVSRIRPGQVVLFEMGTKNGFVLHRVVCPLPGGRRFIHIGDRPGCRPGIAATASIVGRADVSSRVSVSAWCRMTLAVARAGWRRFRRGQRARVAG